MKILFINPAGNVPATPWMPLGAIGICTVLKKAGYDVTFIDEERHKFNEGRIKNFDIICLTGMSHQKGRMIYYAKVAERLKKRCIIGGIHATLNYEAFLGHGATIVRGLGERLILEAVENPWFDETRTEKIEDIDDYDEFYQEPMRDWFGWEKYKEREFGKKAIRIVGMYGCPYRCKFCCNRALCGGKFKFRSPQYIAKEIARHEYVLNTKAVVFAMSTFTLDKEWTREMCMELRYLKVDWKATTRVDKVNEEILQDMKNSGCKALGFGVESADEHLLRLMNKGTTRKQIKEAFAICKKIGLPTFALFMTHVPGETPQTLKETREFAKELDPPLGATFQRFSPLYGSEFFWGLEEYGSLTKVVKKSFGQRWFTPKAFLK